VSTLSRQNARLSRRRRTRRLGSPALRLSVLLRRGRLDRMLIKGTDPVASPELTLRAYQLTHTSHRRQIAASIEEVLLSARTRRRRSLSAVPLARHGIAGARGEPIELARALREEPLAGARGVALARRMLTDGAGPLYVDAGDGALRGAAAEALRALAHPL